MALQHMIGLQLYLCLWCLQLVTNFFRFSGSADGLEYGYVDSRRIYCRIYSDPVGLLPTDVRGRVCDDGQNGNGESTAGFHSDSVSPPGIRWPKTRNRNVGKTGTSQLVTRSTRHTVKSCDELTVVSEGVVTS